MRLKLYGYCAGNLGDDLMIALLLRRYPKIRFFCDSWAVETDRFRKFPNFENMEALQRKYGRVNHLLNILTGYRREDFFIRRIRESREKACKGAVYMGGSIYTPRTPVFREEDKLKNGPLFVVGASFTGDAAAYRDYFRRCGGVVFRDRASIRQFPGLEHIRLAPDVVLNLPAQPAEPDGSVLICVMDFYAREELRPWAEVYEKRMLDICRECTKPVLVSFCQKQGDETALRRIAENLGKPVQTLCYGEDPTPILEAFARADRVIATRLHSLVLAVRYGKPVFALAYEEKVSNLASDMGLSGTCTLPGLETLTGSQILKRCALPPDREKQIQEASAQFALLDAWLEGENG